MGTSLCYILASSQFVAYLYCMRLWDRDSRAVMPSWGRYCLSSQNSKPSKCPSQCCFSLQHSIWLLVVVVFLNGEAVLLLKSLFFLLELSNDFDFCS